MSYTDIKVRGIYYKLPDGECTAQGSEHGCRDVNICYQMIDSDLDVFKDYEVITPDWKNIVEGKNWLHHRGPWLGKHWSWKWPELAEATEKARKKGMISPAATVIIEEEEEEEAKAAFSGIALLGIAVYGIKFLLKKI